MSRIVIAALVLSGCAADPAPTNPPAAVSFERLRVVGEDHRNGLFDVSVEYDGTGTGWLAYSRVTIPQHVETHLARSTDAGRTWSYVGAANRSAEGSAVVGGSARKGVWRYETPTLLFDPRDAPARRWKLFVQRYLTVPPYQESNSLFESSTIETMHAACPVGPWSKAECLFGKKERGCRVDPTALHPELAGFVFFNELGSIVVDGTIYLSMDASPTATGLGEWERRKIVLVASPDHGATWRYVGTLTDYADASALGYHALTGSSLARESGRLFLLVTPSGAKGLFVKNRAHDGTLVVEFEDIRRARLQRGAAGRLSILATLKPDRHSGGLSDYDEQNTWGGILFSQLDLRAKPEFFQLFSTRRPIAR